MSLIKRNIYRGVISIGILFISLNAFATTLSSLKETNYPSEVEYSFNLEAPFGELNLFIIYSSENDLKNIYFMVSGKKIELLENDLQHIEYIKDIDFVTYYEGENDNISSFTVTFESAPDTEEVREGWVPNCDAPCIRKSRTISRISLDTEFNIIFEE